MSWFICEGFTFLYETINVYMILGETKLRSSFRTFGFQYLNTIRELCSPLLTILNGKVCRSYEHINLQDGCLIL